MSLYKTAELISNGLSVVTILLCFAVVFLWHRAALKALRNGVESCEAWFIVGVYFGFIGECLDNLYWLAAWSYSYIDSPAADHLFSSGVFFNIPFRQSLGVVAAYCHIRSALAYNRNGGVKSMNRILFLAVSAGIIYSASLIFIAA